MSSPERGERSDGPLLGERPQESRKGHGDVPFAECDKGDTLGVDFRVPSSRLLGL
jgi:hypothetical protein